MAKPRRLSTATFLVVLAAISTISSAAPGDPLTLWYDQPSEKWTDALPLGNGRLAAMVYGGPLREHLQLNEDTLTSGEPPADLRSLDLTQDFDHVTALIKAGKNAEADTYVTKNWLGRNQQCYQPLGDLWLDFTGHGAVTDYRRWLDLTTATAGVSFRRDGATFTREYLASAPDQVIALRLRTDQPGTLAFKTSFSSVHPTAKSATADDELIFRGQVPGYVSRRELKTIEQWGDQHKYPELYQPDGTRRPHAAQVLYGADIDGKGTFFEARLTIRTDGKLSVEAGRADIEKGFAILNEAVFNLQAAAPPPVPFFRFPGFADTAPLHDWLASRNIGVFGCDLCASDWDPMAHERQLSLVMERLEKAGRGHILFHDTRAQTAAMVPAFLRALKRRDYKIVHMVPGRGTCPTMAAPAGWKSETEAIIAGKPM